MWTTRDNSGPITTEVLANMSNEDSGTFESNSVSDDIGGVMWIQRRHTSVEVTPGSPSDKDGGPPLVKSLNHPDTKHLGLPRFSS